MPLYHIDTTKEEEKLFKDEVLVDTSTKPARTQFRKIFCSVLGAHVLILGLIGGSALMANPSESAQVISDKQKKEDVTQKPIAENAQKLNPGPQIIETKPQDAFVQKPKLKKTYVIKPGDTIFSVCKKYKLNMKELLIKNHIKDPNKIVTGQTLNLL